MTRPLTMNDTEPRARKFWAIEPRGLSRTEAAAYVGIGTSLFDEQVVAGKLPQPFRIQGRVLWDRRRLDAAIDEMQESASAARASRWDNIT